MMITKRPRSIRWKNKPKHCSGWFIMREKHCSSWKNKLKKTDYKRREQGQTISVVTIIRVHFPSLLVPHKTLILRTYLIYFLLYENVSYLWIVFIFFANNYIGDRVFYLKSIHGNMSPRLDSIACVELSSNHRRTHPEIKTRCFVSTWSNESTGPNWNKTGLQSKSKQIRKGIHYCG